MNKRHKADEFRFQGSVPLYSSVLRAINRRFYPFPAVRRIFQFVVITVLTVMAGCSTGEVREITPDSAAVEGFRAVEDFYVVDCLLPGEVRQMGRMIYLPPGCLSRPRHGTVKSGAVSMSFTAGPIINRPCASGWIRPDPVMPKPR